MPTYNGEQFVAASIESVLRQSFQHFELIIVDDCSTDGTKDVVRSFNDQRIRLICADKNSGPVCARNQGLALAKGRYIAALDQDDICLPERLALQFAFLEVNPGAVLVASRVYRLFDSRLVGERYIRRSRSLEIFWKLHIQNPLVWSSVMMRAEGVRRLPVFLRNERVFAEDYDVYHRLAALGSVERLDEVLVIYRKHSRGASVTKRNKMLQNGAAVLADAYFAWFGREAAWAANLVFRHVTLHEPVTDFSNWCELARTLHRIRKCLQQDQPEMRALNNYMKIQIWLILCRCAIGSMAQRLARNETGTV